MEILFIGSFFPKDRFDEIWNNSKHKFIATTIFQQALIKGWTDNRYNNISAITFPTIPSFPLGYKKLYFRESASSDKNIPCVCGGFLNLPLIKHFYIFYKMKKYVREWINVNDSKEKTIVISSMAYNTFKAIVDLKKKHPRIHICLMVLDLPQYSVLSSRSVKDNVMKRIAKSSYDLIEFVDSFICITSATNQKINVYSKPWIILEGLYSSNESSGPLLPKPSGKVKILYSGSLHLKYGIEDMLMAFTRVKYENFELQICGDGDGKKLIDAHAIKDIRIKFLGMLKHQEVLELQREATLLINPRRANEEYTKFSFPSKTIEYMASGTPVIMHKLQGIPSDYFKYLAFTEMSSAEGLYKAIIDWGFKSAEELQEFGYNAQRFILANKTEVMQSKRVFEFLNDNNPK